MAITKEDLLELDVFDKSYWYIVESITPQNQVVFLRDEKRFTGTSVETTLRCLNSNIWGSRKRAPLTYPLWI